MAAQTHTKTTPRRTSCFICCFGVPPPEKSLTVVKTDNKKSASRKTVPIDTAADQKANRQSVDGEIHTSNSKSKWFSYNLFFFSRGRKPYSVINNETASHNDIPIIVKVASDSESDHAPKEIVQEPSLANRKSIDHVDRTCQKRLSSRRKTDAVKTAFSQPGSPDVKSNSKSGRTDKLSQSISLPAPILEKRGNTTSKRTTRRKKHGPVVGLSILMVTLVILLIWGRACTILCTSAWFYFLPSFRNEDKVKTSDSDSGEPDLNSEEYKKRVVLEGFLERNKHRIV